MQFAVFLRAINVGRVNRIRMESLRSLVESCGFEDISTYLQTGNVLLDAHCGASEVAQALDAALASHGLKNANAIVRTRDELAAAIADCPFERFDPSVYRQWLTFFRDPLPDGLRAEFSNVDGVVCLRERELISATLLPDAPGNGPMTLVARKTTIPATTRNWSVARALLGRMR